METIKPIHWPISPIARQHLEAHLDRWEEGQKIPLSLILKQINAGLSESFPARELEKVVETFELTGYLKTEAENGQRVIIKVMPIYFKQSSLTRSNSLQSRHDADERRAMLAEQREKYAAIVAQLGLDPEDEVEELKAKLARHNLRVYRTLADMVAWGHFAYVTHPGLGSQELSQGFGRTESEAICHAAAGAVLALYAKYGDRFSTK